MEEFFNNNRIAVTGAVGTVGRELMYQLLKYPVEELRALDTNGNKLFFTGK